MSRFGAIASVVMWATLMAADGAAPAAPPKPLCRFDAGLVTVSTLASSGDPLIVLYERNPWLMSVGSDFPTVVIYEDGRVLFVEGARGHEKVMSGHVDAGVAVGLRDELVAAGFMGVPGDTNCAGGVSDLVTVEILVRRGDAWKMASAYGLGRDGSCGAPPPKAFVEAYGRLLKLRPRHAKPFAPEEIDVEIWGFENAVGKPVPWPAEVPAPPANVIPQWNAPYSPKAYHHVLPAKFQPQIAKLLRALVAGKHPRAMLLNGQKWTVDPRALWPGYRMVEDAVHCAYDKRAVRPAIDEE
jgi:hypothetical protein